MCIHDWNAENRKKYIAVTYLDQRCLMILWTFVLIFPIDTVLTIHNIFVRSILFFKLDIGYVQFNIIKSPSIHNPNDIVTDRD